MALTINDATVTSDRTVHTAQHSPVKDGWEVSWLPGRTLDRNTAITAMVLADLVGRQDLHQGHRLWPHIEGWAAELGLSAHAVLTLASAPPPGKTAEKEPAASPPDREATGP
jgi:hypothetical protein